MGKCYNKCAGAGHARRRPVTQARCVASVDLRTFAKALIVTDCVNTRGPIMIKISPTLGHVEAATMRTALDGGQFPFFAEFPRNPIRNKYVMVVPGFARGGLKRTGVGRRRAWARCFIALRSEPKLVFKLKTFNGTRF
ncbi:hypothetical protein EVAR_21620_1 [Eumeta japonica]|uniref:Uncharacterized protein n=1 Tax=Eumeta variegata TaxID=151549 RepID=A0A4C1UYZ3_EUMVA|nr:hypothetical protein EVAR_21620_1 [Eumeta japonica]